jgi:hypothetical protein
MGCDTKGYIKGIELFPLILIVNQVMMEMRREKKVHKLGDIELPIDQIREVNMGRLKFYYDLKAEYNNPFRAKLSNEAESRLMYIFSLNTDDPTGRESDYVRYGVINLGAKGCSVEVITRILMAAKAQGYEVWIHPNDCIGNPEQL